MVVNVVRESVSVHVFSVAYSIFRTCWVKHLKWRVIVLTVTDDAIIEDTGGNAKSRHVMSSHPQRGEGDRTTKLERIQRGLRGLKTPPRLQRGGLRPPPSHDCFIY